MSISIIIPIYDEARSLDACLGEVQNVLKPLSDHEIIVIDDGSTDESWERLKDFSRTCRNLRVIRFARNFGKEAAIIAGLHAASGDAAIVMDADLQHPPELIPEMIRPWREKGYPIVDAVKETRQEESFFYGIGARLFYYLFLKSTNIDIRNASDFKLLDRKVIDQYLLLPERGRLFRGLTAWLGFQKTTMTFVPPKRYDSDGRSRWTFFSLLKLARNSLISFSAAPMQLVTWLGIITLVISVVLGIQTLLNKLIGQAVEGFTTVILVQLGVGSILMISLGLIGEYLARIYDEIKARPMYVIAETIGKESSGD